MLKLLISALLWFSLCLFLAFKMAYAEIPDALAVRCIIGEASGEGKQGMIYLASALHNRGTTKGVYGCQADKRIDAQPAYVWQNALYAWNLAKQNDSVNGADHWGSLTVDQNWLKTMKKAGYTQTLIYKNHVFYRRK